MTLIILVIAAVIVVWYLYGNAPSTAPIETGLPEEFHGGKVVLNEAYISTNIPVPLTGRVDQVFSNTDSLNVVIDTKNRNRKKWYPDDQLQLSVYALILAYKGMKMANYGYVRIPLTDTKSSYVKVPLLPEDKVIEYYHLYWDLKDGVKKAVCTCGRHETKK